MYKLRFISFWAKPSISPYSDPWEEYKSHFTVSQSSVYFLVIMNSTFLHILIVVCTVPVHACTPTHTHTHTHACIEVIIIWFFFSLALLVPFKKQRSVRKIKLSTIILLSLICYSVGKTQIESCHTQMFVSG